MDWSWSALEDAGLSGFKQSHPLTAKFNRYTVYSESSDILLHLAGVNEYRGLRVVGDAIWKACGGSHQLDGPRGS